MWIFADNKKIDLTCLKYEGKKETSVYTSPTSYYPSTGMVVGGYTTTTAVCYESAFFVTNIDQIKEMANASTLTFEIETSTNKPVKGTFAEKNFCALNNFVEKVSCITNNPLEGNCTLPK